MNKHGTYVHFSGRSRRYRMRHADTCYGKAKSGIQIKQMSKICNFWQNNCKKYLKLAFYPSALEHAIIHLKISLPTPNHICSRRTFSISPNTLTHSSLMLYLLLLHAAGAHVLPQKFRLFFVSLFLFFNSLFLQRDFLHSDGLYF